jgi:hypothetical protein
VELPQPLRGGSATKTTRFATFPAVLAVTLQRQVCREAWARVTIVHFRHWAL